MKELGAEIVDIEITDLDTLLRSSSVIEYEFKFDLIDYLATNPGSPVKSMRCATESSSATAMPIAPR
jgi:hypothetical protein